MSMTSSAPASTRAHRLLQGLIRGTGALIAGVSVIAIVYFVCGIMVDAIHGRMGSLGWIGLFIAILIAGIVLGLFFKIGYEMFQKLNAITVANFVFTLSIVFGWDFYHLLLLSRVPNRVTGFDERQSITFIACYFFYRITKAILLRVLGLNTPDSAPNFPPNPKIPGPDVPEFPEKSPLVPL
jgi:hypothetical protein